MSELVEIKATAVIPPFGMGDLTFEFPREHDVVIEECDVKGCMGLPASWVDFRGTYLTKDRPLYGWHVKDGAWGYVGFRGTSLKLTVRDDLGAEIKVKVTLRGRPLREGA